MPVFFDNVNRNNPSKHKQFAVNIHDSHDQTKISFANISDFPQKREKVIDRQVRRAIPFKVSFYFHP